MHWRTPWGRGMTTTDTTCPHTSVPVHTVPLTGTWLYTATPQAPPSTHWDMAVRCPAPSPTLHSLGHGCTLPHPKPHPPLTGTWLYAAPPQAPPSTHWNMAVCCPPQAPPSTHWGMAVCCPTLSPTLYSLEHGCTLPHLSPTLHSLEHGCMLPHPKPHPLLTGT